MIEFPIRYMADSYYRRLLSRTWRETKDVWTSYRLWLAIAPPIAGVLLLVYRKGSWSALINAQEVLINAVAGIFVGFVGSLVIGLFKSTKLLDNDRAIEIEERDSSISSLKQEIERFKRKPYDEAHEALVRQKLDALSTPAREALQFLLHHGETNVRFIVLPSDVNVPPHTSECFQQGFLDMREVRPGNGMVVQERFYNVKEQFRDVLQDIFYPSTVQSPNDLPSFRQIDSPR